MDWRKGAATLTCCMVLLTIGAQLVNSWGSSDQVRLEDVQVLTLYSGRMTSARRSSPIPQLKCIGGNAGCHSFAPQVVQCYNRGSDGVDVQWECKTDMDNAYRFGRIEVSCEGYDYPDDPYILKGSCGLEYTLDLTKEGHGQQNQHNYYGNSGNQGGHSYSHGKHYTKKSSWFGDLIMWVVIGVIFYAIYKSCTNTNRYPGDGYPPGSGSRWGGGGGGGGNPPPPGFRSDYMPDGSCSSNAGYTGTGPAAGNAGGGGFWTGAATGGLLGYMFGNRNNRGYGTGYGYGGGYRSGYPRAYDSFGTFTGGGGHRSSSSSTGTRTASGFGGTSRR
ncbi:store-operated calcium entry-associated regulatory factor-like [Ptychodera flava]|uniref:store-operated calcium entry-associated regulatory factor-like n=1 Tax=Ptychodera flava TaxID=63121 RepID=UPI00396A5ED5